MAETVVAYEFGELQNAVAGYATATDDVVTITSIGSDPVTIIQPTSEKYYIGELSTTTLSATGSTATFTVQPKAGLPAGNHDEIIAVTGSGDARATVTVKFTVKPQFTGLFGDVNSDNRVNGTDVQTLVLWINAGKPEWKIHEDAGRVSNTNGRPDAGDVLELVLWINRGGIATMGHPGPS